MKTQVKTRQDENIEWILSYKQDAQLNEYKDLKIVTHIATINMKEKPALMVWKGKQKNAFHNFYYNSTEAANEAIQRLRDSADRREQRKEETRRERAAFKPDVKIGDIYVASWGYEQTNVDFYQVIEVTGKCTVKIRPISQETVKDSTMSHGMADDVVAVKDSFIKDEVMTKRVGKYGITIDSVRSASKWDGSPCYRSWYY